MCIRDYDPEPAYNLCGTVVFRCRLTEGTSPLAAPQRTATGMSPSARHGIASLTVAWRQSSELIGPAGEVPAKNCG